MDYIIKKLWGENAAELHKSSKNIYDDFVVWTKQAVVVSAIRSAEFNTTDKLIELWEILAQEDIRKEDCHILIKSLREFHLNILDQKLLCSKTKMIDVVDSEFNFLESAIDFHISENVKTIKPQSSNDYTIRLESGKFLSILGFWEIVCCRIFSCVIDSLSSEWICSKSVDLSNIVSPKEVLDQN